MPEPEGALISGYYASWAAYSGYTPSDIPAERLTDILYAFANIDADLKIALGDPAVDLANFAELRQLKRQYPHVRTLISVGGWTWSGKFSDVALTEQSRSVFADSVVAFIRQHGFDGVDVDWEYPCGGGLSTNTTRPQDKTNFTLLMAKLREKLDAQGQADGREYLLTFAGGAGTTYAGNTELGKLGGLVDYGVIMTYDMHGAWAGSYTDFNAPLYTPSEASPQYKWSCAASVDLWQQKGFPKSKIVMGIPFYGIRFNGVQNSNNGLYQRFGSGGSIAYDKVVSTYLNNPLYVRYTHPEAHAPWLFDGSTFISYDDAQSIAEKAGYIANRGLGGAVIWELSQNADGTLISAIRDRLR